MGKVIYVLRRQTATVVDYQLPTWSNHKYAVYLSL